MGAQYESGGERWIHKGKPVLPMEQTFELVCSLHGLTHLSLRKMKALLDQEEDTLPHLLNWDSILQQVIDNCKACAQVNAGRTRISTGTRVRGQQTGAAWEVDFTEVKPGLYGYKYLLVFVDPFSGWVEVFPTKHETAKIVSKKLLEEIFPRYGMPQALGSDNGPAFVSQPIYRPYR
ncbi:protein NYNRIN-like [Apodemus sylvaticus]|uniref:protein NYNRIN-like n=1 Tax=Apodemus sylvaticus TaxID=10129 RepID=UPI0022420768|nr:protein NYNRIN-like [Apodemus sylvaticus]